MFYRRNSVKSKRRTRKVYDDGYHPNRIIGLWRGGSPVGLYMHEALKVLGVHADYIPVITRGYKDGVDNQLSRVATVYYKPERNRSERKSDYFICETDQWLVFPHELGDCTADEIEAHFGTGIAQLLRK